MRVRMVHLDDKNTDYFSLHQIKDGTDSNRSELKRKAIFLKMLIANELTDMQRICATAYWLEGEKQKDIASHLGLHKSTVSRHIKAAKKKLQNVAQYYD